MTDQLLHETTAPVPSVGYIIVTGAAGFIGSCMVQYLNAEGYENLVLVDDFGMEEKRKRHRFC